MPAKKTATKKIAAKKRSSPKKAKTAPAKRSMSDEHKAALASGRQSGRAVRAYLNALENNKPKRGRKRTPDSIARRLERIESDLPTAEPIKRLGLLQEQQDLQDELVALNQVEDLSVIEAEFVTHAKTYGEAKGITYAAWRAVGVPADVLRSAGVTRRA